MNEQEGFQSPIGMGTIDSPYISGITFGSQDVGGWGEVPTEVEKSLSDSVPRLVLTCMVNQILAQHMTVLSSASKWCHDQCLAIPFVQGENVETALEVPMASTTCAWPIHHSIPRKDTKEQPWSTPWDSRDLQQGQKEDSEVMKYGGPGILLFWIHFWLWILSDSACFSSMSNKNSTILCISISIYVYTSIYVHL